MAALTSSPHSGVRSPNDSSENDESRSRRGGAANGRNEEEDGEDDPEPALRGELPFDEPLALPPPPPPLLPPVPPNSSITIDDVRDDA